MNQTTFTKDNQAKTYLGNYGLPVVSFQKRTIPQSIIEIIPKKLALKYKIIAYDLKEGQPPTLFIAVADPEILTKQAPEIIIDLKKKNGVNIQLAVTSIKDFEIALKNYQEEKVRIQDETKTPMPTISLIDKKIPYDTLVKFPKEVANKYQMVVFAVTEDENLIKVALVNPDDRKTKDILDFIRKRNHLKIEKYQTSPKDIRYALALYQQKPTVISDGIKEPKVTVMPNKSAVSSISQPMDEMTNQELTQTITGVPLAKPLPSISSMQSSLPPLKEKIPASHDYRRNISASFMQSSNKGEVTNIGADEIKSAEFEPKPVLATSEEEEKNLDILLPAGIKSKEELVRIIQSGSIPKILSGIIFLAATMEASDIHIEPTTEDFRLRYRVDGLLSDIVKMPTSLHPPLVSRIKILSKLKIDEQRIPQDGRFEVICNKKDIDLRVSTLPTIHGEKVVIRLLDKSAGVKTLEELGFIGGNLQRILTGISKPYGIVLSTGPTGAGKTTTLYAVLNRISKPDVNIVTLEDPVEYEIPGINQCQIKPKIGFGFAEGLRSILRQDPNIIMVGEIRDTETASMATHAALTGHLVLSTLHTNDSAGALPRLINMGVEPFLITSSINCIVAERLVRRICPRCRTRINLPLPVIQEIKEELAKSGNPEIKEYRNKELAFYKGKGCEYCTNGYKGRIGIFEVLLLSGKIEDLAIHRQPADVIARESLAEGMISMKQDGIMKVIQGLTTVEEVIKAVSD